MSKQNKEPTIDEFLSSFAIGVRYSPNFKIRDHYGTIADKILYDENTFFSPKIFQKVLTTEDFQEFLINEDTQDKLKINNIEMVLEVNFENNPNFSLSNKEEIIENFDKQIIKDVLEELSVREIRRLGIIHKYVIIEDSVVKKIMNRHSKTFGFELSDVDMRFSHKLPTQKAILQKGIDDYDNAIFSFSKKADLNQIILTIDFQSHFIPPHPNPSKINFDQFLKSANNYRENDFTKWVFSLME